MTWLSLLSQIRTHALTVPVKEATSCTGWCQCELPQPAEPIWWCLKRLHAQPLQLSFSKTKLSDQHPADITTSYDIHFKHSHSTPLPSSSQGSPNFKKLFDGKVLESAQQIASTKTKLTSIEFYKYFESVLSCYVCVWGSCAALGWNALAGVLVTLGQCPLGISCFSIFSCKGWTNVSTVSC